MIVKLDPKYSHARMSDEPAQFVTMQRKPGNNLFTECYVCWSHQEQRYIVRRWQD